jgi:hypothetical protein
MSRDWAYYSVQCKESGNVGKLGIWVDDWNRWGSMINGFDGPVRITGAKPEELACAKCHAKNPEIEHKTEDQ